MFNFNIASSETLSKYLTSARKLFPCADIKTFFPFLIVGAIVSCQYGKNRSTVSFKHSVKGISSDFKSLYFGSVPGYLGSDDLRAGGGTS